MTRLNMDFSALEGNEAAAQAVETKKEGKAKTSAMMNNFAQKIQANPELKKALFAYSKSIRVVNSCGYADKEGIIEIKKGDNKLPKGQTGREVGRTSKIVGYIIENIGNEPITFTNGVWSKNAEGVYVEEQIEDVINPGEKKPISRKYLTIMAVRPEFSLTLENGRVVGSSSTAKAKSAEALIESYHFKFNDSTNTVHDDRVKIAIADKKEVMVDGVAKDVWTVKPEFEATFGNLNNPKASVRKTRAAVSGGIDFKAAAAADYVKSLLESSGIK